jgi:hypothetical protein
MCKSVLGSYPGRTKKKPASGEGSGLENVVVGILITCDDGGSRRVRQGREGQWRMAQERLAGFYPC